LPEKQSLNAAATIAEGSVQRLQIPKAGFLCLLITALALLLRLLHFKQSANNPLYYAPQLDEAFYIDQGRLIAAGNFLGDSWTFFMDPLYSYFLALLFLAGGDLTEARLLQILIDSLNCLIIFHLCKGLSNERAALIAALCYALMSTAIFYAPLLLKTSLSTFVLLAAIYLLHRSYQSSSVLAWFVSGIGLALAVYARGNFILLIPLALAVIVFFRPPKISRKIAITVLLVGLLPLFMLGAVRNYWVNGEFQVLINNTGYVMYSANNSSNPIGEHKPPNFIRHNHPVEIDRSYRQQAKLDLGYYPSTSEASRYWFKQGLLYWLSDIQTLPRLIYQRSKRLISNYEWPNNYSMDVMKQFSGLLNFPLLINYGLILALGAPGLALLLCSSNRAVLLLLPIATILATCLIFYTVSRLRFPLTPFLAIGAGYFIDFGISLAKSASWKKLIIAATAFIVILSISSSVEISKPHPAALQYQLAQAYYQNGQFKEAGGILATTEEDFEPQRKQLLLANIALQTGDFVNALKLYQQLLQQNPLSYEPNFNLGLALLLTGSTQAFEQWLLSLHTGSPTLAYCLATDLLNSEPASMAGNLQSLQKIFSTPYDCTDIR